MFTVEPSKTPGVYVFQFKIDGREFTGRATTTLTGMAVVRAKSAINRRLRIRHDKL